ncbi:hypothetical protein GCM10023093_02020 [Nemorincola caseinilytica]|uniref:Lipocalin-like domain-containing protein n=1 Tax=Nemorincola caseinilytica TaxID=2054315 RepID=A0ABP8N273_9BACT
MIRNIPVFALAACFFLSTGIISCTKDEKQPLLSTRLAGKWKKVRYATDDNVNGLLDEWETHPVDSATSNILEFKQDSTGVEYTTNSPELLFSWYITSEQTLSFAYKNSETTIFKIARINSANLELTTRTKNGLVGYYYDRTN